MTRTSGTLRVSRMPGGRPEVFRSLQGEGATAGTPTVFLRLATCNLTCTWCDTRYTWDWEGYDYAEQVMEVGVPEVEELVTAFGLSHLVITGGEPMMQQRQLAPLVASLNAQGYYVEIETNGTLPPSALMAESIDQWNVSPKTSNSGNRPDRREVPTALAAFRGLAGAWFKFVVCEPADVEEITALVERHCLPKKRVLLMPEGTTAEVLEERSRWLAEICVERGFRLSPRLHVLLWGAKRGR